MNCCDEYGNCRKGRDCPARVAKVGQRTAIEAAEKQEPVAWSITCDGEHCGNFFFRECDAVELHKRLNLKYPNEKREVVSLYTHPPHPHSQHLCRSRITATHQ